MSNQTNTELKDTTPKMTSITNPRQSPRRRRLIQAASATVTALLGVVVFTVTPASATDGNIDFHNGYTADASVSVTCDRAYRTITVNSVNASAMKKTPYFSTGFAPGAYDGGQYVTYNVWISVDHGTYRQQWGWDPWQIIQGVTVTQGTAGFPDPVYMFQTTQLNRYPRRIQGGSGHTYEILVQVDWWTGVNTVANITWPAVTYTLSAGGLGQTLSSCAF